MKKRESHTLLLTLTAITLLFSLSLLISGDSVDTVPSIRMIDPDRSTGSSAATIVEKNTLAHTALILPLDQSGDLVGAGDVERQFTQVASDLEKILTKFGSSLNQVVQMNVCIKKNSDLSSVRRQLATLFMKRTLPAITFIAGDLPQEQALVGIDAVAVSSWKLRDPVQWMTHPNVYHRKGQSHVALLRWGETIYLSGWVHRGKGTLAEAVDGTLAFQQKLLNRLGGKLDGIVRIRVFLKPETERDAVEAAILKLFKHRGTIPPVVYTPWANTRTPEIELIAAGRSTGKRSEHAVEYFNVPELAASPVFSRATRVRSDRRIYISGLAGKPEDSAETQVKDVFKHLQNVLKKSGSDINQLVKATYFMGNRDAFKTLGDVRKKLYDPKRPPAASGFLAGPSPFAGSVVNMDMIAIPSPKHFKEQSESKPTTAMKSFKIAPGFRMELVAADPLLRDPVAIAFDEFGRLFVVEYPEYNQQFASEEQQSHGNIRMLEDTDGDGKFDKSTIYVEGLKAPSAVGCYGGGLFVAAAPDVFFCKDTTGDGKADEQKVLFTGFRRLPNRTDPSLNSFHWGLDNRFHACTSYSGATVRAVQQEGSKPRSIGNRNFLFDPRTLAFDLSSGGGQHGLAIDDWGREFLCNNSSPVRMLMYDDRYLARNPYLKAPAPAVEITEGGKHTQLFRISPEEKWRVERTRLRTEGKIKGSNEGGKSSGFFTAATGVTIYRGDAWPEKYRGNVFVGEPANNLVFRAQLKADGVGLIARRADRNAEFLASTDNSFRPVQFANGPDGCLYVIDMHRELIEGAMFLPPELLKEINVTGGSKQGRIYRIAPENFKQPEFKKPGEMTTVELVALLEHQNGWHRDTASRLLYERQDKTVIAALKKLATESSFPVARVTAMYALDGLEGLNEQELLTALDDTVANVRIHAMRLAEKQLATSSELQTKLLKLTDDENLSVRYQLAFTLGELKPSPERTRALVQLAVKEGKNEWMQLALHSSLAKGAGELFQQLARNGTFRKTEYGRKFLIALTGHIAAAGDLQKITAVVESLEKWPSENIQLSEEVLLTVLTKQSATRREKILANSDGTARKILEQLLKASRTDALNEKLKPAQRSDAIHRLVYSPFSKEKDVFTELLSPQQANLVQSAAVETVARYSNAEVAELLIARWPKLTPELRSKATVALLYRTVWTNLFLDAIEQGVIARGDLDPARVKLLKQHRNEQLASRVRKLFANSTLPRRKEIVQQYQSALEIEGDAEKGKQIFKKICSACHRLDGVGTAVGADLKAISDRGRAAIMLNILDPNREVKPKFLSYSLLTEDGLVISGMIANESVNSITIRQTDGTEKTVLRIDIDELRSSGFSFMPEGLEKQIDKQAMANLLTYLLSQRTAGKGK